MEVAVDPSPLTVDEELCVEVPVSSVVDEVEETVVSLLDEVLLEVETVELDASLVEVDVAVVVVVSGWPVSQLPISS